jgi:predicted AlkP superfamily phosphohydrolase/phosphomutase
MNYTKSPRVLMILLDAAEPRLIEQWIADGSLPAMQELRARGVYGRLESSADWLGGSPWPTFYTSRSPADHGFYSYLAWRAESMASVRPTPDYLPLDPFWYDLSRKGPRVIAIDIPLTYEPEPFHGVQVSNWATHDALVPPGTHPPELMNVLRGQFGAPQRTNEEYGLLSVESLLNIRDNQNMQTRGIADVTAQLMKQQAWDFCLVAFSATHRCGHKLWDHSGVDRDVPPGRVAEFDDALRQVYINADRAVKQLMEQAGSDVSVLVGSLHGMGANTSRAELLPTMLERVLAGGPPADDVPKPDSFLRRVRELVPNSWRNRVKGMLPLEIQDWLTSFWRIGRADWSRTRAFCLVADLQGFIRFNVRGREAEGIVEPGEEYDRLAAEIAAGLESFVDADTGERVVREIKAPDALYSSGARRDLLPDLIVQWSFTPMAPQRQIVSPKFGKIDLAAPGKNVSGRSGNHRPHGFLIAAGPGVGAGVLGRHHIMDLAPTVYALLGQTPPESMQGRPIVFTSEPAERG